MINNMIMETYGYINSVESMGLVDGPGIRYVVFLQGCQLRCLYCHNPETWDINGKSQKISPQELVNKIVRFKSYFGNYGGVTFSGGEPLLQPNFLLECLKLCKQKNISTAIDTAGVGFGDYDQILEYTDLVILDIKATEEEDYKKITGQPMVRFKNFLNDCQRLNKKLWLRQVIVPGINDNENNIEKLKNFIKNIKNVEKVELLPYKTIGAHKYKDLKLKYRLEGVPDMDENRCRELEKLLLNKN